MSNYMDGFSGRYSAHSRPRANTAASALPSPMSEMGPSRYPAQPRESDRTKRKIPLPPLRTSQTYSGSPGVARGERSARSPLEYGPEPFEEYCSPTRSATSGLNELLTRRTSDGYGKADLSYQSSPRHTFGAAPSGKKKRSTGYSFRSLLSVLTGSKHTTAPSYGKRASKYAHRKDELLHIATKNLTKDQIACITPTNLKSGPLLYLARRTRDFESSPALPVWTATTAQLHQKHLLVTWETSQGNPFTRIIELSKLVDACSLSLDDIGSEQRRLLPTFSDRGRDLHVFEIQFNGKRSERFAAYSAEQRTGWIDAIWLAYRQSEDDKFIDSKPLLTIKTDHSSTHPVQPASAVTSGAPSTLRTHHGSSVYSNRSLPPTPTGSPLKQSSRSSSPHKTLSSPTRPGPRSPGLSIKNHDQRSIYKKNPAKIVQNSSNTVPTSTVMRPSPSPTGDNIASHNIQALSRNLPSQPSKPLESLPLSEDYSPRDSESKQGSPLQDISTIQIKEEIILAEHLNAVRIQLGNIQRLLNSDPTEAPQGILQAIEAMQSQLNGGLPDVVNALENVSVLRDRLAEIDWSQAPRPNSANVDTSQLMGISDKLDTLLNMHGTTIANKARQSVAADVSDRAERELKATQLTELQAQLKAINETMKTGEARQTVSDEQLANFGRYLNELNSWLETLVNGGSHQIQAVAAGVQRLCQELGCDPSTDENPNIGNNPDGLSANIRQLVEDGKKREEQTMALQASINGLLAIVREDVRQSAKSREKMSIEAVASLVDRHGRDQDQTLQALESTLTHEIRGEKIRFIDAIKEATEIKVQAHVEKFKKELTREVFVMTQDLGRLSREKQTLEEQIADLFAFLSKQKENQGLGNETPHRRQSQPLRERVQNPTPISHGQSQRRPLPNTLNPWNQ